MESEQPVVSNKTAPPSGKDWDELIDFVREEYLAKNRGIKDVFESLRLRNSLVTYTQFRAKLKEWGFKKNLTPNDWRYIDRSMKERESQLKESVVIYSGMRLDQNKVKKQMNRTKDVTLSKKYGLSSTPESPKEDALYVCTPRAVSPMMAAWPESLPWFQFLKTTFPELLRGLRLLPESETGMELTVSPTQHSRPRKKRRLNVSSAWTAFEGLVRRSMEIVIGSEELTQTLLLRRSVDRIADHFDQVMPTTYPNENLTRAMVLSDGQPHEVQREVLKIILYLVSNHLIMDHRLCKSARYIADARAFVDICRYSGLTEPHVLSRIVEISLHSPAMEAMVDLLYEAAVNTESTALVAALLEVDGRINPDRPVGRSWWLEDSSRYRGYWSALQYAILRDSLELASCMLQHGADANYVGKTWNSPLTIAATVCPNDASSQFIPLLLQYNAVLNETNGLMALYFAIPRGCFKLIDQLHEAGADFTSSCPAEEFSGSFYYTLDYSSLIQTDGLREYESSYLRILHYVTPLGLAASFSKDFDGWIMRPCPDRMRHEKRMHDEESMDDEEVALKLVKQIICLAGPTFDLDGKIKSDAMIHAASRGYNNVISFLHAVGARVDSKNGYLCPVYAAVNWNHVETCRQLLRLGGSAQAERRGLRTTNTPHLSPLHIAAGYGSRDLVRVLIESGVDVNLRIETSSEPEYYRNGLSAYLLQVIPRICGSPLNVATIWGFLDVALLLLDMGATATIDDLTRAVSCGQPQLVSRLLEQLPRSEVKHVEYQLQSLIREGKEQSALEILGLNLPIEREQALSLAIEHGQPKIAMKLIESETKLTVPQLIWAFQILDESTLRERVKLMASTLIGERSSDRRTLLENSILGGNIDVINYALSLKPFAYDSGALCAVVLATVRCVTGMDGILQMMLRKRDLEDKQVSCFDPILENTAVSIAAYYRRLDIVAQLQKYRNYEINAAVLQQSIWNGKDESIDSWTHNIWRIAKHWNVIGDLFLSMNAGDIRDDGPWDNWHDPNRRLISPLFFAIKSGSVLVMEKLLGMQYNPDAYSLQEAIYQNVSLDLASRLIKDCTDIDAIEAFGVAHYFPPIYMAAAFEYLDIVKMMLDANAKLNIAPWYVRSAVLQLLIESGRFDVLDILLRNGIDIKNTPRLRLYDGRAALEVAARKGHLGIIRRLLEYGADPNAPRAVFDLSAIEAAAYYGRLDAVQLLLDYGVTTEGHGRLYCILAVLHATHAGHSAAARLLKSRLSWTDEDEKILYDLEERRFGAYDGVAVIDYGEDTEEEVAELLDSLSTEWKNTSIMLIEIGHDMACKIQRWRWEEEDQKDLEQKIMAHCRRTNMGAGLSEKLDGVDSVDEASLSDGTLHEEVEMVDTGGWFEHAENESENIQLGRCSVAEEDRVKQVVLRDMLGEEEMPFEPVEQPW
ncbi:ankyrin [Hypoxylon cercidicola]|nr:ankyrin [Hypoxylon cercidicola]